MSDGPAGPGTGDILGGIVLIFFGLCILLVGGGCTIAWFMIMFTDRTGIGRTDGWGMLLISMVAAAAGLFAIVKGVQMFRGRSG
jgi:hypothetical protein